MNLPKMLFMILLGLFLITGVADSMPSSFYGTVTLDGTPFPTGTIISAKNNIQSCGVYIVRDDGIYGQYPATNASPFIVDCPSVLKNDRINFYINGVRAREVYDYQEDSIVNLSLSVSQEEMLSPNVNFTTSIQEGTAPLRVDFIDNSDFTANSWSWDFGDNSDPSFTQNAFHIYLEPGVFDVHHSGSNSSESGSSDKSRYITIFPHGDFNHDWKVNADDSAYLSRIIQGDLPLDLNADLNRDGAINESDISWFTFYGIRR